MSNSYIDPTRQDSYDEYLKQITNQRRAAAEKQQAQESGAMPMPTPEAQPLKYEFPTKHLEESTSKMSDYGHALAEEEREAEVEHEASSGGIGTAMLDTLNFVTSPFMALGDAVIAPISVGTEGFGETAQVSWNAFKNAMMPEYCKERPEYGKMAARNLGIDEKWGIGLEILTDPTLLLGGAAMKVFQKGLRSTAAVKGASSVLGKGGQAASVPVKLGAAADDAGPWQRGIEEFLGASRPAAGVDGAARVASLSAEETEGVASKFLDNLDITETPRKADVETGPNTPEAAGPQPAQYTDPSTGTKYTKEQAIDLAKRADLGDKEAMNTLTSALNKSDDVSEYAQRMDALDGDGLLANAESYFGDIGGNNIDWDNAAIPGELLSKSASSNVKVMDGRINLAKSYTDDAGGNNIIRRMEEVFSDQFDKITKSLPNAETVMASQQTQLRDVMGMKVAEMGPKEAYVLRQSLLVSADNLHEAAKRATHEFAGPMDEAAFDKALAFHTFIQHKAKGAATHAGRLLQSYNITATTTKARMAELNDLLGASKLC